MTDRAKPESLQAGPAWQAKHSCEPSRRLGFVPSKQNKNLQNSHSLAAEVLNRGSGLEFQIAWKVAIVVWKLSPRERGLSYFSHEDERGSKATKSERFQFQIGERWCASCGRWKNDCVTPCHAAGRFRFSNRMQSFPLDQQ